MTAEAGSCDSSGPPACFSASSGVPSPGAVPSGRQERARVIELAHDGQSFAAIVHATTFDPNGNVLASFTASASAKRMEVGS